MAKQRPKYDPDVLITPGEVLEDYLGALKMTQVDLSLRSGLTQKTISLIIKGKAPITAETALKFEKVLGRPMHFWMKLESDYKEDLIRFNEKVKSESELEWLSRIPYAAMAKLGWVKGIKDKYSRLDEVKRFFGVASAETWKTVWEESQVAYRQAREGLKKPEAVSAWLRKGELEAGLTNYKVFNRNQFLASLEIARTLTVLPAKKFVPRLKVLCENAGVAFVLIPELPGLRIYGATRWVGSPSVPLIQMNLRGKTTDLFWFTFFHEAGHLLKHGKKEVFLEGNDFCDEREAEADEFAREMLIPAQNYKKLLERGRPTLRKIIDFANGLKLDPGIVVGRLQKEGAIAYSVGNHLKTKLQWELF